MYKTGALIVSSSKLLLPALAAAARVVSGVLYVPLDYVGRVGGPGGGGGGVNGVEGKYLHEASQQVILINYACKLVKWYKDVCIRTGFFFMIYWLSLISYVFECCYQLY